MAKYYAVKVGKKTGIFDTWEECKENVTGYPGALYKSFKSISEAYEYMGWEGSQMSLFDFGNDTVNDGEMIDYSADNDTSMTRIVVEESDAPFSNARHAVAYVDGSFNALTNIFSYGVVMFYNGEEFHLSDKMDDKALASMRNVARRNSRCHGSYGICTGKRLS